jgi:beta-glucosidase/6-phospho-beta-glucosidase/beta-galactosidase
VIKTCLEYGVKPIVTLTHFDPPLYAQYNSTEFADSFLYYSQQAMARFGDRVQDWVAFNEPNGNFQGHYPSVTHILSAGGRCKNVPLAQRKGLSILLVTLTLIINAIH